MKNGYGRIQEAGRGSKNLYTHVVSYQLNHGEIPEGLIVRHTCDNPPCCNPDHLILGTYRDNASDMLIRNREARGERAGSAKLTESDVCNIRREFSNGSTKTELAAQYAVTRQNITRIINYETWTHV